VTSLGQGAPAVTEVRVPKMGMSTIDVDVTRVFVATGDVVSAGDPLVEIEGDKVSFVVEAECSGTVTAISVEEGATYEVGQVICTIEEVTSS